MSKAVLLSIRPDWVKKIASGDKTVEVRKTCPQIDLPFKCYIYCTQPNSFNPCVLLHYKRPNSNVYDGFLTQRVIGEFVCDWIVYLDMDSIGLGYYGEDKFLYIDTFDGDSKCNTCLTRKEILDYTRGKRPYGWHISDLVIYDKPKKLEEFVRYGFYDDMEIYISAAREGITCLGPLAADYRIKKPPQSWMYVEELV